jgi:hypothetical protein
MMVIGIQDNSLLGPSRHSSGLLSRLSSGWESSGLANQQARLVSGLEQARLASGLKHTRLASGLKHHARLVSGLARELSGLLTREAGSLARELSGLLTREFGSLARELSGLLANEGGSKSRRSAVQLEHRPLVQGQPDECSSGEQLLGLLSRLLGGSTFKAKIIRSADVVQFVAEAPRVEALVAVGLHSSTEGTIAGVHTNASAFKPGASAHWGRNVTE